MIPPDQIGALAALLRRRQQTPLEELIPANDPIWELIFSDTPGMGTGATEPGVSPLPGVSGPSLDPATLLPVPPQQVRPVGPFPNVPYATTGGTRPVVDPATGFARPVVEEGNVPISLPVVPGGKFGDDFGVPRPGGRTHKGIDIFAPAGTPIYATMNGTVSYEDGATSGLYAKVTDPETGTFTYNMHLDRVARKPGPVKRGEIIGYVGNTGNAVHTAPHNHFELHPAGGDAINPYGILSQIYELTRDQQRQWKAVRKAQKATYREGPGRAPAVRASPPATSPQQRR